MIHLSRYGCVGHRQIWTAQVVGEYDLEKFFVALVRRRFEFEFELLA
jgi:hypothetical protein